MNFSGSIFSLQAPAISSKNFASIGFVLEIMRFDTVNTLINRYGTPDFAQFIQMETNRIKHF